MNTTKQLSILAIALGSLAVVPAVNAQTVLKFSHTDQQQGARLFTDEINEGGATR